MTWSWTWKRTPHPSSTPAIPKHAHPYNLPVHFPNLASQSGPSAPQYLFVPVLQPPNPVYTTIGLSLSTSQTLHSRILNPTGAFYWHRENSVNPSTPFPFLLVSQYESRISKLWDFLRETGVGSAQEWVSREWSPSLGPYKQMCETKTMVELVDGYIVEWFPGLKGRSREIEWPVRSLDLKNGGEEPESLRENWWGMVREGMMVGILGYSVVGMGEEAVQDQEVTGE
ncbi:hypothetical protein BCR34DRAFT_603817 [Clohesyomyces aquaticus]|uniref:Uncharacterized protein n=1 Tax=Clohesyomyces aquaticus TaxID=1231657 RepID=A0A1Y1ZBP0_9PLEO|nr:hypothetical protein BCR34DRAFT_603817 [Clohesyomyces aquaticus]